MSLWVLKSMQCKRAWEKKGKERLCACVPKERQRLGASLTAPPPITAHSFALYKKDVCGSFLAHPCLPAPVLSFPPSTFLLALFMPPFPFSSCLPVALLLCFHVPLVMSIPYLTFHVLLPPLNLAQRNVEVWQSLFSVRQLVVPMHEDVDNWLKFASLCRKVRSNVLCVYT